MHVITVDSPIGWLLLAATPAGLARVGFGCEDLDAVRAQLAGPAGGGPGGGGDIVEEAARQLLEHLEGRRAAFDLPLDRSGTSGFRRRVLDATAAIPIGETRSYAEVAAAAGSPAAVRAAGTALAANALPIVIPCHRVVRGDGVRGGYRGGAAVKHRLLEMEAALAGAAA